MFTVLFLGFCMCLYVYMFVCYACDRHALNKRQLTYLLSYSISGQEDSSNDVAELAYT